jgi:hypothetical protein
LKENLVQTGILNADLGYYKIIEDRGILDILFKYLCINLATDINKSQYGLGVVNDYDMFFKCSKDADLVNYIKDARITVDAGQFLALGKKRRALRVMLIRYIYKFY